MMGGQHGAQAAFDPNAGTTGSSPWGGSGSSSGGDLSRQAGLDDIGRAPSSSDSASGRSYGALDDSSGDDVNDDQDTDDFDDSGFDSDSGEDL